MTLAPEHVLDETSVGAEMPKVAEFFAGIGLVRLGLERAGLSVVWANDIDPDKALMYKGQFGDEPGHYVTKDINDVQAEHLPEGLALAWASFPCIDVSLAGNREGLRGKHTGTFWSFIRILKELGDERPPVVALENVTGLATSNGGQDLIDTVKALNDLGYSVDVMVIDARHFVAQSRPRLFVVGTKHLPEAAEHPDPVLRPARVQPIFQNPDLRTHQAALPSLGPLLTTGLSECVERLPSDSPEWWDEPRLKKFLDQLSDVQEKRLHAMRDAKETSFRTAYRRTRNGVPVWEIRPDEVSGCLRTARGGSSKQAIVQAGNGSIKVRWMTGREYANLMGASEYKLDNLRLNQTIFGFGDAVSVDAVEWLAENYLVPLLTDPPEPTPS